MFVQRSLGIPWDPLSLGCFQDPVECLRPEDLLLPALRLERLAGHGDPWRPMATRSGVDQLVIPQPPLVGQFGAYHGIAKIKKYEICGWSPISGKGSPIVIPVSFPVHRW